MSAQEVRHACAPADAAAPTRRWPALAKASAGGFILWLGMLASSGAAFLFHVVVSRNLLPADYGALGALLGLLLVLAVPASALQVVITRAVAARRAEIGEGAAVVPLGAGTLLAQAVIVGIAVAVALVVSAPLLQQLFRVPSLAPAAMVGLWALPTAIGVVPKGVLLGEERYLPIAVGLFVGAVSRLGLGWALTLGDGNGLAGAMAATVAAELIATGIMLVKLPSVSKVQEADDAVAVRWPEATGALLALAGFWALAGVDTWVARRILTETVSGFYTAAAIASRAALFLPSAIALVAFPHFAKTRGRGPEARRLLAITGGLVGVLSFAVAAAAAIAPKLIITLLFGSSYVAAASLLPTLAVSAAFLGVVSLLLYFHLASERLITPALPWLAVGSVGVTGILFADSATDLARLTVASTAGVAALMAWIAAVGQRPLDRPEPAGALYGPETGVDLTVVVPYYNPGPAVKDNVERIVAVLDGTGAAFEVVTVADGCTDGSEDHVARTDDPRVVKLVQPVNLGKGAALKTGLAVGSGRYIGFIDADGEIDESILAQFVAMTRTYEPDVILATKRHPMSKIDYPPIRRLYSWVYQQIIRLLFQLNVRDTQTGAKLVRRDVLAAVLPRMVEKRFAFDLELLVVARHLGYRGFFETPVTISHGTTSSVNWRSVYRTFVDTLAIFYRLRMLRWYDQPPAAASTSTSRLPPTLADGHLLSQ